MSPCRNLNRPPAQATTARPPRPPRSASKGPFRPWALAALWAFVLLALLEGAFHTFLSEPPSEDVTAPQGPPAPERWTYLSAPSPPGSPSPENLRGSPDKPASRRPPALTAAAAILVEPVTMTVLYAHNEHERRAPASTTKIMTALLALEYGRMRETVTVSPRAASIRGSSIHLRPGQHILFSDLLHGLLMRSGNDAAVAIAEHIAGSEEAFVRLMNQRARQLGALNTRFRNSHGLDEEGHYSTAFDLAHLARLAMTYPTFRDIVARREYQVQERGWTWRNTNRLLWRLEGVEGVKTGTTGQAGNCLVAAASRDGMTLISVVLGSANRWEDSGRLLEWGFDAFHVVTLAERDRDVVTAQVPGGLGLLRARPRRDVQLTVWNDEVQQLRLETTLDDVRPPIRAGQPVGFARVLIHGQVRDEVPLVAAADVPRWTPLRALWHWLQEKLSRWPS